jgi:HlyD family secretion protein
MQPISRLVRRPRIRRALIGGAALIAAGAAAWLAIAWWRRPEPVTYTTTAVVRSDVVAAVTASGTLSPVLRVEVGSQVSGRVKELLVDYNDPVAAGQVIARLDPEVFESAVSQAKARLGSAQADLARARAVQRNAKAQHARAVGLLEAGTVAAAEVDVALADMRSADAQVIAARAKVTEAQAALDQARTNLAYTTITAPIDGIVIARKVDVGQTVAASLQAPTLFVLAGDLRDMEVHTSVAESDVGRILPGLPVEFSVDAFPERTFTATVKQVRYEATTVSNVVTYDAVISVRNEELLLRPGMTANATFVVDERDDVLVVPLRALRYQPPAAAGSGGRGRARGNAVWVLRGGEPARVAIETGLSDGTVAEVVSGELREGDPVIVTDSTGRGTTSSQGGTNRSGGRGVPGPPRIF